MRKKKNINFILLLFPIIDFLTSIATWENLISLGILIKGLFLVYVLYNIWKKNKQKKIYIMLALLLFYGLGVISYWYFKNPNYLKGEIINLFKIYYLPLLILYFGTEKEMEKKTFCLLFLEFLLLYLIPYPFHLGHNINEIYPNKNLYLSYFYVGNELANIFVLLIPISFTYLIEEQKKLLPITLVLTACMLLLLGTKTMYLSVIIIIVYLLFYYRKEWNQKIKKYWLQLGAMSIITLIIIGIWLPKSSLYNNIKTQLEFYKVNNIKDLFTLENINNILYSNRLEFLNNIHKEYKGLSTKEKLFGLGRTRIMEKKDIEIDILDIFYSIGLIGFIIYTIFFIFVLKTVEIKGVYQFTFILLCVISLFTGHVLISPMTTTYLASIFGGE